jgi:hypothetical protein
MKSFTRFALVSTAVVTASLLHAAKPPAGFKALFNEKDLTGWRGGTTFDHRKLMEMPEAERAAKIAAWTATLTQKGEKTGLVHWRAEGDELVNDGGGNYATTEKDYGDFELLLDYKTVPQADSGIYLRGVPQIQIWDINQPDMAKAPDRHPKLGSGGLYNNKPGTPGRDPLVLADRPFGEWNHFRILMVGSRVSVWLNEKLVVDHAVLENYYDLKLPREQQRPIPARGPIQLQTHGGEIRWRNIFLREIGSDEACQILSRRGDNGFKSIFNGRNLNGWAGPLDVVEARDGAMIWRAGKGGTVYWNQELADFQARLHYKLPAGGNNGLAIRYPGTGNPAYDGMTEVQILDDNYEQAKKAKIDARQAHGSVYGMVAAARGYQHPIGEWNFEEVTVQGSRIKVEVNGTVILDADVAKVDLATVMANHPHPGKDRKSGYFGFAGHNDPVQFKEIKVKKL